MSKELKVNSILVIDCDELELQFTKSMIEKEVEGQYSVFAANTKAQALQQARVYQPDIIFMDIYFAENDGVEIAMEIRKYLPDSLLCIITASTDFRHAHAAVKIHAHDYILKPARPDMIKSALNEMIRLHEERNSDSSSKGSIQSEDLSYNGNQKAYIEYSLEYIQENFKTRLKLPDVAAKVFMNPQYFSRVFKKEVGVSFTEYVNKLKIEYACKLLETTDYPAYRIASECGFTDPSYFNRVFYAQMNITPQKYKKSSD